VITATNKANQMLGHIKKSFARFDRKLFRSLYLTIVRPLLEFAVPVWSPILKSDCDSIERIQHRATKMVASIRNLPYERRLKVLDLTTLVERRKKGDLIQMYKIMDNKHRQSGQKQSFSHHSQPSKSSVRISSSIVYTLLVTLANYFSKVYTNKYYTIEQQIFGTLCQTK